MTRRRWVLAWVERVNWFADTDRLLREAEKDYVTLAEARQRFGLHNESNLR